jgi:hypothetical protein
MGILPVQVVQLKCRLAYLRLTIYNLLQLTTRYSQILIVRSLLLLIKVWLLGLEASANTQSACPVSVRSSWPVAKFQSLIVRSMPPLRRQGWFIDGRKYIIEGFSFIVEQQTEQTRNRITQRTVSVLETVAGIEPLWLGVQRLIRVERTGIRAFEPYQETMF